MVEIQCALFLMVHSGFCALYLVNFYNREFCFENNQNDRKGPNHTYCMLSVALIVFFFIEIAVKVLASAKHEHKG